MCVLHAHNQDEFNVMGGRRFLNTCEEYAAYVLNRQSTTGLDAPPDRGYGH